MRPRLRVTAQCSSNVWAVGIQAQVTSVAGTNFDQPYYTEGFYPQCSSCSQAMETCEDVPMCEEVGCVDTLKRSIGRLDGWLKKVGTEPSFQKSNHNICGSSWKLYYGRDNVWLGFRCSRDGKIVRSDRLEKVHVRHVYQGDASDSI